jgi:thioredoxin-dependent peroxiredoxin
MKAPDFMLPDQSGNMHSLHDFSGRWLVLYFYPQDDTPGCTTEACNFRDARDAIAEFGNAAVVGISKDSVSSHKKFVQKYGLNFTLLSDPDHKVIAAYGAWKPKKFMGREFLGTHRNTVIITPSGEIAKQYEGVDPRTHAAQIIADLKALQANA